MMGCAMFYPFSAALSITKESQLPWLGQSLRSLLPDAAWSRSGTVAVFLRYLCADGALQESSSIFSV